MARLTRQRRHAPIRTIGKKVPSPVQNHLTLSKYIDTVITVLLRCRVIERYSIWLPNLVACFYLGRSDLIILLQTDVFLFQARYTFLQRGPRVKSSHITHSPSQGSVQRAFDVFCSQERSEKHLFFSASKFSNGGEYQRKE